MNNKIFPIIILVLIDAGDRYRRRYTHGLLLERRRAWEHSSVLERVMMGE